MAPIGFKLCQNAFQTIPDISFFDVENFLVNFFFEEIWRWRQNCLHDLFILEELEHFEQVLALIKARGRYLEPLPSPGYGADLARQIRKGEPQRMLDSFLVAGLIEARSHERMALLAEHSPDPELRALYGDLLASEARHFGLYWLLCEQHWPREVIIPRLEQLAAVEVEALSGELARPEDVRMHSVGVQLPRKNLDPVAFTPT